MGARGLLLQGRSVLGKEGLRASRIRARPLQGGAFAQFQMNLKLEESRLLCAIHEAFEARGCGVGITAGVQKRSLASGEGETPLRKDPLPHVPCPRPKCLPRSVPCVHTQHGAGGAAEDLAASSITCCLM